MPNTGAHSTATLARALGVKLGLLLAATPLSEDERESWLALIPEMTPEQLIRFSQLLEVRFFDAATAGLDAAWRTELTAVAADRSARTEQRLAETIKTIAELTRTVQEKQ